MDNRGMSTLFIRCNCRANLIGRTLQLRGKMTNARLGFAQSVIHSLYFYQVFILCSPLCSAFFSVQTHKGKGIVYYTLNFYTRSLPLFTELFHLSKGGVLK